ncbi:hypothetical protein V8F20_001678 [Naviculisporaceae sp. PSN 640]
MPINGCDFEIQQKWVPKGFKPRWGGPFAFPGNTGGASWVERAYDTETYTVMVDSREEGNWTRYINSSCDPNLQVWPSQVGKIRVLVFKPIKRLRKSRELTFFYGSNYFEDLDIKCACRAQREPHDPYNESAGGPATLPPALAALEGNALAVSRGGYARKSCSLHSIASSTQPGPAAAQQAPVRPKRSLKRTSKRKPPPVDGDDSSDLDYGSRAKRRRGR